jgi:predicted RNase H-like nuclease (RuvC/YqgF family)
MPKRKTMQEEEWSEKQIQASQIAGLQSMINGWTINIQMLEAKIEEIKTKIDNIKKNYSIDK